MIATLTLNAALDLTFLVERLEVGRLHTTAAPRAQAGGKGVNVSRVLHAMGVPTLALVLVAGATGRRIVEDLERCGIPHRALPCPGESRTCLELVERGGRHATQVHGGGVRADATLLQRLFGALDALPAATRWLALCGSQPSGMPVELSARLVHHARARGFRVAVDTHGPPLVEAAAAGPDLLRINRDELAEALGAQRDALRDGAQPPLGAPAVTVVSDAEHPVVCWAQGAASIRLQPPRVAAVNPIGCGDAMLAGLLAGLEAQQPLPLALRDATALAAAEAASPVAGRPDLGLARALRSEVHLLGNA